MRALGFDEFKGPVTLRELPAPVVPSDGVVVRVGASGICRSDWHGWQGHDPDIQSFPHVPGHEFAGTVSEVGPEVKHWAIGDRVVVPFVNACGRCERCLEGNHQVCEFQRQPGFTQWGSFAQFVAVSAADVNLVLLPDAIPFGVAASLGCRFTTAFRAVAQIGRAQAGEWVAVHGCGGVGLAAVQIAAARGARVIAIDVAQEALARARSMGAEFLVSKDPVEEILSISGGAHLSLDAFGSAETCLSSIGCLRPRGRHVQVGLLPGAPPPIPMSHVIAAELEIHGSHGMAAHGFAEVLGLVESGVLRPQDLISREIELADAAEALTDMGRTPGITVITEF